MKLLVVDNHDSFTFNLVQLIEEAGCIDYDVVANNEIELEIVDAYTHILFSPGPGLPNEFTTMNDILEKYHTSKKILGVCLGHQAIAQFFGANLLNLSEVVHGQQKRVCIDLECNLFKNIDLSFDVGLYHSWLVDRNNFPDELDIVATTHDKRIMALRHKTHNIYGVQFHPESIMTPCGKQIIQNWLNL